MMNVFERKERVLRLKKIYVGGGGWSENLYPRAPGERVDKMKGGEKRES